MVPRLKLYSASGDIIDMNETVRAFSVPLLASVREHVEGAAGFGAACLTGDRTGMERPDVTETIAR